MASNGGADLRDGVGAAAGLGVGDTVAVWAEGREEFDGFFQRH